MIRYRAWHGEDNFGTSFQNECLEYKVLYKGDQFGGYLINESAISFLFLSFVSWSGHGFHFRTDTHMYEITKTNPNIMAVNPVIFLCLFLQGNYQLKGLIKVRMFTQQSRDQNSSLW